MTTKKLAYEEAGAGRPVLLVHGFPFHRGQWDAQLAELALRARVIAPDLRGFGGSALEPGADAHAVTMEQHADDLAALLDELGVREPVVYVGFSMGGYVAWPFFRKHRRRLAALALCNTRAVADTSEGAAGRAALAAKVLAEGPAPVVEAMLPRLLAPRTLAERADIVRAVRALMEAAPRAGVAAALRGMAQRPDSTTLLPRIDVPTLAVVGEFDAISPPAEMRELAAAIPGARLLQLAGAGHMTTHEAPAELARALAEFVSSLA